MDTKWKSRLTIIAWLLLFTFGISGVFSLLSDAGRFAQGYYDTDQFEYKLNFYARLLGTYELDSVTEEEAKASLGVTEDEIDDYLLNHMVHKEPNVAQEKSGKIRKKIRAEILQRKKNQLEEYYQRIEEKRPKFANLKSSFKYYLKDLHTDVIYTDMNIKQDQSLDQYLKNHEMAFVKRFPTSVDVNMFAQNRSVFLKKETDSFSGIVTVPESLPASSVIAEEAHNYHQRQMFFWIYTICGIIALFGSLFMLKRVPVFQYIENEKWQSYYNRVPADICLLALIVVGCIAFADITDTSFFFYYQNLVRSLEGLVFSAIFAALTLVQGKFLYERFKDPVNLQQEWEKSLLNIVFTEFSDVFLSRNTGIQTMVLLIIIFASGFGIPVVMWEPAAIVLYIPLFLLITVPALIIIFRRVGYFNRIVQNTTGLVRGNVEPDLSVKGESALAVLAVNVNKLKHGVEVSQAEQAKSERFKTELITNVSHDLRTPLTSIITYAELLRTPELAGEDRDAYIEIIDRKSKRLKVLIEDLFEASKMASGSIELVKEKVDVNQLLQQALAENNEVIDESTLQFRVSKPETPVYCVVDGQKLWRVFDNLIGNILKYSLDHTRVYISVKTSRDQVVIAFKNITKYELSENIDELFERFKRGDESRHTDGSGLGLAIAKSIVDLHGGSLDIEVDGDLFKVTVSLQSVQN